MWCDESLFLIELPRIPCLPGSWVQGEHMEDSLRFFSLDPACDGFSRHLSLSDPILYLKFKASLSS